MGTGRDVFSITGIDYTASIPGASLVMTSATIGVDGLGLIAYYHYQMIVFSLNVVHCSNVACTAFTISTLDSIGGEIPFPSVAIGADGLGLISYYDSTNGHLKVAHCSDIACTAATVSTIDNSSGRGQFDSITIGADGLGLISYYGATFGDFWVAHCSNVNCTTASINQLDLGPGTRALYTSATIGADGLPLISYYNSEEGYLKVAHCSDVACASATYSSIDPGTFQGTSITVGTDGLGIISYLDPVNGLLKVAHCSDIVCTTATTSTIEVVYSSLWWQTSMTIGSDGLGFISYFDGINFDLRVAHCSNVMCTAATSYILDGTGGVGMWPSVTIGVDGFPLISYYDVTNNVLKVAHLSNVFGIPYVRYR
jgi:hypothetical protein